MNPDWVEAVHEQCKQAGVAFFFKQWGGVRKDMTGRELNGRTYDEMPLVAIETARSAERVSLFG